MKLLHFGNVDNGVLVYSDRKQFDAELKQFEGKRIEVVIQKAKKSRSAQQNAWYWSCIVPTMQHAFVEAGNIGVTKEDTHEFLKDRFLKEGKSIIIPKTGEQIIVSKTTTTLSTIEFNTYVEQIMEFAASMFGVVIPEPLAMFQD